MTWGSLGASFHPTKVCSLVIQFLSSSFYRKADLIRVTTLNVMRAHRKGEYVIHPVVVCNICLRHARCSEGVSTCRLVPASLSKSLKKAVILFIWKWAPILSSSSLNDFCVRRRCRRVLGPSQWALAACLLVCLPASQSPPPSLNSTFLCSLKALHSKDPTTQEWVLLPFLSSFFFFSLLPVLHARFLLSAARPEAPLFHQWGCPGWGAVALFYPWRLTRNMCVFVSVSFFPPISLSE